MASRIVVFSAICVTFLGLGCNRGKEKNPAEAAAARPVPVSTFTVAQRDVPIYLDGLGTVTAWKTVTVRSQVDGKLDKVLFREGQRVKQGDVLAQIDPRPFLAQLHQAEGAQARDEALAANSRLNLERYNKLREQNLIAQQAVDDQKAMVAQQEGALSVDKAQIETARLNLSYSRIVSPIEGVTGVRLVDEGNLVRANDATGIVIVTQIDPIAVFFTLPEDDLHRVAEGMRGTTQMTVEAYDRDGEKLLGTGKLLVLDNQINQATATLRLKAVFENPKQLLWPNQFIKARLLLTVRKAAILVPATAVQRGPKGAFAYVVKDDIASPRPIEVEQLMRDQALITSGLSAGDEVVVEGQNQLKPGAKVQKQKAGGKP